MKRILFTMLAIALLFALTACGQKPAPAPTPTLKPAETPQPSPTQPPATATPEPTDQPASTDSWDGKTAEEIMSALVEAGDIQIMMPELMAVTPADVAFLQLGELDFQEGAVYMPMISSQRFDLAVFRLAEDADPDAFAADLKERNSQVQWICAAPPDFVATEVKGDVVLYISIDSTLADGEAIRSAFLSPAA